MYSQHDWLCRLCVVGSSSFVAVCEKPYTFLTTNIEYKLLEALLPPLSLSLPVSFTYYSLALRFGGNINSIQPHII